MILIHAWYLYGINLGGTTDMSGPSTLSGLGFWRLGLKLIQEEASLHNDAAISVWGSQCNNHIYLSIVIQKKQLRTSCWLVTKTGITFAVYLHYEFHEIQMYRSNETWVISLSSSDCFSAKHNHCHIKLSCNFRKTIEKQFSLVDIQQDKGSKEYRYYDQGLSNPWLLSTFSVITGY